MNNKRIVFQNGIKISKPKKNIVYWMHRDHRIFDNWALVYAHKLAEENNAKLTILFCLRKDLSQAFGTRRMLDFIFSGLKEVEVNARILGISFELLIGQPTEQIPKYINQYQIDYLISDFSPLNYFKTWTKTINKDLKIPFEVVDTHNIIPCPIVSSKQEFSARTFRIKVQKYFDEFLDEFPKIDKLKSPNSSNSTDWERISNTIKVDELVKPVNFKAGQSEANKVFDEFLQQRLKNYSINRNDPSLNFLSQLSPYLHFGHISSQRIVLELQKIKYLAFKKDVDTFIEELVVRKELSDNFCFYNSNYKSIRGGAPLWAQETLNKHLIAEREAIYTLNEFEQAKTHDPAWNAAQVEMVITGKMHGYMRMYWAKKILEWTLDPQTALDYAIYLNDKYSIDGRDPNGYVGCLWAIAGLHDRPWGERPVFGKIRYMNYKGLKRKFEIEKYIKQYL